MADKTTAAWTGAASSLALTCVLQADRLAKFFGIINIPKDARETMSALSAAPSFLSFGILAIGGACVVYLYLDHLKAIKRRFWNPKLDLLTIGLLGLVTFAGITALGVYRQSAMGVAGSSEKDAVIKNVAGPPIEWRFDKPVTILFTAPRAAGEAVWIDALQIHGTNKSDKPLKNVAATIIPDMTDQKMEMRVNPHGVLLKPEETATLIPPRADFDLMVTVPSTGRSRLQGLPADEFLRTYGGLKFEFAYDNGQNFLEYFSLKYIEDQIDEIERQTRQSSNGTVPAKQYGSSKTGLTK